MDLREWIATEHLDVCARLRSQVLERVPVERWDEPAGGTGTSVAWVLWHTLRHQDVAVNAVVLGGDDVLSTGDWAARVGADRLAPGAGLSEADDRASSACLVVTELAAYAEAVWSSTAAAITTIDLDALERIPDAHEALRRLRVSDADYDWLYRMWDGKPVSFHLRWEAIAHSVNHLGELANLRSSMGIRAF